MTIQKAEALYGPPPTEDTYYCPAETWAQTRDSPAEYCEEEVPNDGDYCARHDEDDEEPERGER